MSESGYKNSRRLVKFVNIWNMYMEYAHIIQKIIYAKELLQIYQVIYVIWKKRYFIKKIEEIFNLELQDSQHNSA